MSSSSSTMPLMLLLLFVILSTLTTPATSVKLPQCNQISFQLNTTLPSGDLVYQLNFMINVTKTRQFYQKVELYNFKRWSANDTYVETYPLEFFAEDQDQGILCNSTFTTCGLPEMRDGLGTVMLSLQISSWEQIGEFFMNFWFMEGTVYNSRGGDMFDPVTDNCFYEVIDWGEILFSGAYCCSNYFYVNIPAVAPDAEMCLEFYGETNFTANNGTQISNVGILYSVFNDSIAFSVNKYSAPAVAVYTLGCNLDEYVKACTDNSIEYPCVVVQPRNDTSKDHTYNFIINVADWHIPGYDLDAINGQIVYRNQQWLKNMDNPVPYTRADPCWTMTLDANNQTTASSKFCCQKWTGSANLQCAEYRTKTVVTAGGSQLDYLYSNLILNQNKTISVKMLNYTTASNNIKQNVQLEIYSSNGKAQYCTSNVTTSGKTCLFKETTPKNTLIMRTSDFADGWDMASVEINGQVLTSPSLTPSNPCNLETHPYNGVGSAVAKTEFCCIASANGPWPGTT